MNVFPPFALRVLVAARESLLARPARVVHPCTDHAKDSPSVNPKHESCQATVVHSHQAHTVPRVSALARIVPPLGRVAHASCARYGWFAC